MLETQGWIVTGTAAQFESFDRIIVYDQPGWEEATVTLQLSGSGALDLSDELEGQRAAAVYASADGNTITTGDKDDGLYGGDGNDTLNGGAGNDTIYDDYSSYVADADTLNGGDGNDQIYSHGGQDTIDGGAGNDRIYLNEDGSRTGTVDGGADRDVLSGLYNLTGLSISNVEVLETQGWTVTGTAAQFESFDRIIIYDDTNWETNTVSLQISGAGALDLSDEFEGQRGAVVQASNDGNAITTGAGDDTLYGGTGNDTLDGGIGNDTLYDMFAGDADTLNGGDGDDTIYGLGPDTIDGGAGADTISVNITGNEPLSITGGSGDDRISLYDYYGYSGSGILNGGTGRDVLVGIRDLTGFALSGVEVLETQGWTVTGTAAQFESFDRIIVYDDTNWETSTVSLQLSGGGEIDLSDELEGQRAAVIYASSTGNTITAGAKDDTFYGDDGNDGFRGGLGNDTFHGGDGVDTAYFNTNFGSATITAYNGGYQVVADGTDTLYDVEKLRFADGIYDVATQVFTPIAPVSLYTNGQYVTKTVEQFESYDKIQYSAADTTSTVILRLSNGGTLDLSDELQGLRAVNLFAANAGNTVMAAALRTR